ncbi:MAG: hypothetical protein AAF244_01275 [Pseudomonadota bacterium]
MVYRDNHLYKHLKRARTAFYLSFTVLLLMGLGNGVGHAQEASYTIDNVKVDVTASSAVEAREQAFQAAQIKAYEMLAKRILDEEEFAEFETPSLGKISSLVRDFEVTDEKLSTTRYNGTYKFSFRPHVMGQRAQAELERQKLEQERIKKLAGSKTLIIPMIQKDGLNYIWAQGPYRSSWQNITQKDKALIIPNGTSQDRLAIRDEESTNYDYARLSPMIEAYEAEEAVMVVTNPQARVNGAPAVEVKLYQVLPSGASFMKKMLIPIYAGEKPDSLFNRVASQSKIALENEMIAMNVRKKKNKMVQPSIPDGPSSLMTAQLSFNSMREWVELKKNIERTTGIISLIIKSMSARTAVVDIGYQGDLPAISQNFRQQQLILQSPIYGTAQYGQPPLYQLTKIQ